MHLMLSGFVGPRHLRAPQRQVVESHKPPRDWLCHPEAPTEGGYQVTDRLKSNLLAHAVAHDDGRLARVLCSSIPNVDRRFRLDGDRSSFDHTRLREKAANAYPSKYGRKAPLFRSLSLRFNGCGGRIAMRGRYAACDLSVSRLAPVVQSVARGP
jgi:hypothetical protein